MNEGSDERAPIDADWSPEAVQRLRARLGLSQAGLAARVGTRQQTISEWETGARAPRRMSRRLLRLVAEAAGVYELQKDVQKDLQQDGAHGGADNVGGAARALEEPGP